VINIPDYIVKIVIQGAIPQIIKELFEQHETRTLTGALYERYRLNKPGKVFNINNKDIQLILSKSKAKKPIILYHARVYFFDLNNRKGYEDIRKYYSLRPEDKKRIPPKYLQTVIGINKESSEISKEERAKLKNNIMIDYYELDSKDKNSLERIITNIIDVSYTRNWFMFKICCMGAKKKTELIRKIVSGKFTTNYLPTLGVDITTKRINTRGIISNVIVVDTAGQEFFGKLRPSYYRGASVGIIFVEEEELLTIKQIVENYKVEFRKNTSDDIDLHVARIKLKNEKREDKLLNEVAEELQLPFIDIENPRQLIQLFEDIIFNLLMKK
jgi:hypothetical protein